MTDPATVAAIADGLTEAQRAYVLATPMQIHADAGLITARAGTGKNGNGLANFSRKYPDLFHRIGAPYGNGRRAYRLSPLGLAVRKILEREA